MPDYYYVKCKSVHTNIVVIEAKAIEIRSKRRYPMAGFDKENKLIYEDLSPSLQALLKNKVKLSDLLVLIDKLQKIDGKLAQTLDNYIQKDKIWQALHRYPTNYVPADTSNQGWNKLGFCIINYSIDGKINKQPKQYGQLLNIPYGEPGTSSKESTQIWIDQNGGDIRVRGGNSDIKVNNQPFKKLLTEESAYPIGSIYMTTKPGNPANVIGYGIWVQIKGAYLYATGADMGDINASTVREGSNKVKLNVANMPAHSHTGSTSADGIHSHTLHTKFDPDNSAGINKPEIFPFSGDDWWEGERDFSVDNAGQHAHTFTTDSAGEGKEFEIAPLRVPIYAWYRSS